MIRLALPMFVFISFPADAGIAAVAEAIPAHGEYWANAMFIFKAQSLAAARAIAEDPMHASGARQSELRPWLLNH